MNESAPSEVNLILDDGICKTSYPVPPDSIVRIELDLDDETGGGFAILDADVEMQIDSSTIELVTHYYPDIAVKERFNFMRFLGRL